MLLGLYGERKKGGSQRSIRSIHGKSQLEGTVLVSQKVSAMMAKRAPIRALNCGDWTYGEGAMQRGEELLKRIVAFMGV